MRFLYPFRSVISRIILLSWLICHVLALPAQQGTCRAHIRTNRHKALKISDPSLESMAWHIGNNRYESKPEGKQSRIFIWQNDKFFSSFLIEGQEITSPIYSEYDNSGNLTLRDSIDPQKGKHAKQYLNLFQSRHVWSSTRFYPGSKAAETVYYNSRSGKDSICKAWYYNGFPKYIIIKDCYERDSVSYNWDSTGIMRARANSRLQEQYYPTGVIREQYTTDRTILRSYTSEGILKAVTRDTMISGVLCRQQLTYYPSGILNSVEYYSNAGPCLTWLYYTPQGIFLKRVNKGPILVVANPPEDEIDLYAKEKMFSYVEQQPHFPGGEGAFRKYMQAPLAGMLCRSRFPLKDRYRLRFSVDYTGKAQLLSAEGYKADLLYANLSAIFSSMPVWVPARQAGWPVSCVLSMDLKLEKQAAAR